MNGFAHVEWKFSHILKKPVMKVFFLVKISILWRQQTLYWRLRILNTNFITLDSKFFESTVGNCFQKVSLKKLMGVSKEVKLP